MLNYEAYDDVHLVKLAQSGDQASFNVLYDRHFSAVYNRVRYKIPDADVDDVTQDIFIAVLRSLHNFHGRSQFSTWIRAIVNRQIAGYYRSRERHVDEVAVIDGMQFPESDFTGDQKHTERIAIRRAMQHLPNHYQEVLLLRFAEGLKFKEIAGVLEQNPEAVKSLFRRAMAMLRTELEDQYDA